MKSVVEEKLAKLGFTLPTVLKPVAGYLPAKRVGDLVYVSGWGPIKDSKAVYTGQVGREVPLEDAYKAAQICALNCLAAVKAVVGSLDRVAEIVQVHGFVNSAPSFYDQPGVINGASELLIKVFGEQGKHARAALGVPNLPGNIPVEVKMIVRITFKFERV